MAKKKKKKKQVKSDAIRFAGVSFILYRLFAPQGQATRAEGDQDCASTRDPDRPPPSPHPKEFIKIGLRPIAWTAIFATFTLRIGA